MARKTKAEAERTRARIMASALSLFVSKGYEHTTFEDIAERLQLTKGAVYWHFDSKVALLEALLEEMLNRFHQQLDEIMPRTGLTFPAIAEAMVENAVRIANGRRESAFFLLMKTQIKWGVKSMAETRERLLSVSQNGPYHAFRRAVENDIAQGRVRKDVDPVAVATVGIAVWDGLVRSKIEKFLQCDLAGTLRKTYEAMWNSIKIASV